MCSEGEMDRSYCTERIRIYKLYLSKIPEAINEADLMNYFSQYGELESSIEVQKRFDTKEIKKFGFGYVCFKNACSAENALRETITRPSYWNFKIEPANCYLRKTAPEQEFNEPKLKKQKRDHDNDTPENLILKLNDDCLLHIFSFLSLRDQMILSKFCDRFRQIFSMSLRYLQLYNDDSQLTFMEQRQLILQYGSCIREICCTFCKLTPQTEVDEYFKLILQYCYNLRTLRLEFSNCHKLNLDMIVNLSINLKNLTKLQLPMFVINDEVCKYLIQLSMLEYLDIRCNGDITGKYLSEIPKLINLNLNLCTSIKPKYFSDICKNRKLKSLNINLCNLLDNFNFEEMESTLHNLTHLVVGSAIDYNAVTPDALCHIIKLKNLTVLTIYDLCENYDNNFFQLLANEKKDTLEELTLLYVPLNQIKKDAICSLRGLKKLAIYCNEDNLTDDFLRKVTKIENLKEIYLPFRQRINQQKYTQYGIGLLFEKFINLRILDIGYNLNITTDSFYYIYEKIKKSLRLRPCTLYAFGTSIPFSILMDEKYLECESLLKIQFETKSWGDYMDIF